MRITLSIAALVGLTLQAHAIELQFFGEDDAGGSLPVPNSAAAEADFLSNLVGVGTEDFESYAPGSANGLVSNFSGAGSATFSGSMSIGGAITGTFPISGNQQVQGFANNFNISFSDPVAAFGFYATDVGDVGGTLTITYANGPNTVIPISQLFTGNGNAFYFGYINTDNPFTGVSFNNSSSNDRFGYDNMTIGSIQQVSVPDGGATLSLFGLAMCGLGFVRKKLR